MRAPDKEGAGGRAWYARNMTSRATLGVWIVNAPNVHPFWEWWAVIAVHLRDEPGLAPARRDSATATHELIALALNPEAGPPDVDALELPYMTPPDQVVQFEAPGDAAARRTLERVIDAVVDGNLPPDQDWRSRWATRVPELAREDA